MIVKIMSSGKSFKGLASYLAHDPDAETDERVAWTHTLNLANDHVPSAIDEMLWTARSAELLKQEAGIRAGGRETENPVKHISLNWAPEETPTREHMISTGEEFLRHMGWDEHQALLIAHNDKSHSHVHLALNCVHPETGLKLDESFEQRRAQAWALEYEREQGRIYCDQRLLNPEEREEAPTRPAWMAFQKRQIEFDRAEKILRENKLDFSENQKNPQDEEWKILKEIQRDQRETFFAEGKSAFHDLRAAIFQEIREEYRERWSDFYTAKRDGADSDILAVMKAELVTEQNTAFEKRRDEACQELRETRDGLYRELLDHQREGRLGLRWRQEAGLESDILLDRLQNGDNGGLTADTFRDAAEGTTLPEGSSGREEDAFAFAGWERDGSGMRSGAAIGDSLGTGIGFGLLGLLESVADGFIGGKPAPRPRLPEPDPPSRPDPFKAAAEATQKRQEQEREEADEEWRRRQRSL